jgi:hypothetical protein
METIQITKQAITEAVDFSEWKGRLETGDDTTEFYDRPGRNHYWLLAYLGSLYKGRNIIDIGTHKGSSALALSYGGQNCIHTFDIEQRMSDAQRAKKWGGQHIVQHYENLWDPEIRARWEETILGSAFIFLDIDPHDGPMEYEFYTWLREKNYQGFVICDDIWYFKGMRDNFWYHIPGEHKIDCTLLGHWSGTGIFHFGGTQIQTETPWPIRGGASADSQKKKDWTVVTAYFNLTKRPDASQAIKDRPQSYYLANANMTMALDQNLVVFCDTDSYEPLKALRPAHLAEKTRYILREFDEFSLVQDWYEKIRQDRLAKGYNADPRNTVSYYLFCMLRYVMLREVIDTNPFNSTHFAWCNICIERMSWKNGVVFPHLWNEYRDKFSTCYIDYQPKKLTADLAEYYQWGRCGMCSGFFTGNKFYMGAFCDQVLAKFAQMASLGYGHADEQLFTLVYFQSPGIFEFYLGDYTEMIVNYGWVMDRPEEPVKNVMKNLWASGENWELLYELADRWLQGYTHGTFSNGVEPWAIEHAKYYLEEGKRYR